MQQFNRAYQEVTGDLPMLEIDPLWWVSCVGNSNTTAFDRNPLVLISKASSNEKSRAFEPFGSWKTWTFRVLEATWSNKLGTEAQFNGDLRRLKEFAASPAPVNEDFYTGEVINGPPEGYYSPNWKRTNPREASRYADFGIYEVSRGTDGYWSNLKFLDEAENLHFIHGVAHKAELATGPQTQARYFLRLIGNRKNATTLPGILRLTEKGQCSGLTPKRIVGWIQEFSTVYRTATGVPLILYTNNDWWTACTGNSNAIRGNDLFLAGSDFKPFGPWKTWKFRQTGQYGAFGNLIQFNGDLQQLKDVTIGSRLAAAV
ncbi:hypothetical protein GQ53DRAFT_46842 [Thozetella sp. PMI_491]|nr:hypothetical protein GQ53DRAFT_46842 [Thozetella sp. PMI_491]